MSALNHFTFLWLLGILNISMAGSILLIAALAINRFLKRGSAGFKFHLIFLVLCFLLILPAMSVMFPKTASRPFPISNSSVSGLVKPESSHANGFQSGTDFALEYAVSVNPMPGISTLLFAVWLSGFAILGLRNAAGITGMYRLAGSITHRKTVAVGNDRVRIGTCPEIRIPVTCGLFKPIIILPENYAEWPAEYQQAILFHENAHIKRYDNLIQLWIQFIASLYWFIPFVWAAVNQMRINREKACDDWVLRTEIKPSAYAAILLEAIRNSTPGRQTNPASLYFISKGEKRMKHILDSCVDHRILRPKTKLITLFIIFLLCIPLSQMQLFAAGNGNDKQPSTEFNNGPIKVNIDNNNLVTFTFTSKDNQETVVSGPAAEFPVGWPEKGVRHPINSFFGTRFHPILKQNRFHSGIDIGSPLGTPIVATADGKVVKTDFWKNGYGWYIIIQHKNFSSLYSQLQEIKVKNGAQVKQGDLVAYSGSSGLSTGPHMHYEIRYQEKPVDPIPFINAGKL